MECAQDCTCGSNCQNQRIRRRQYADVTVILTEKKGYGLRINADLDPGTLIFEYIGEVIGESIFRRRLEQYDREGIKHFYFMSLTSGEFVDATKKGNLGRFCNHSCNPNCFVDKWVVDDRLRMGIFSERRIEAGEELTFNYNVDRYGANPQPCYCGEINCTGFIGGKTQTERATKLSALTIEALGIEDADDWDTAVAKKGRTKKKTGEDDEEYVDRVQPKTLDEAAVTKVMATLRQSKEKWIVVKLLSRLQEADDDRVRGRVVRMHGYQILKSALSTWLEDVNVVLQVFDILRKLPMITRNKIQDSKIEDVMQGLKINDDERVKEQASNILVMWSKLEVAYRIPRQKRDPGMTAEQEQKDREERRRMMMRDRGRAPSKSRSPSPQPPKGPSVLTPTGPRLGHKLPQRPPGFFNAAQRNFPPRPPPAPVLPSGWFEAFNKTNEKYYYNSFGGTTWDQPTAPAGPPPPPPKVNKQNQAYQDIINDILSKPAEQVKPKSPNRDPLVSETPKPEVERKGKKEAWRDWPESKQRKVYETTISPIIIEIMSRYKNKIPKDTLKRFAKDLASKIVDGDFKKNRVEDPKELSKKKRASIRDFVKDYFKRAAAKRSDHDKRVAEREVAEAARKGNKDVADGMAPATPANVDLSPDVQDTITPDDGLDSDLKRKREDDETPLTGVSPSDDDNSEASKRFCSDRPPMEIPPPPPRAIYNDEPVPRQEEDTMDIEAGTQPNNDVPGTFTKEALQAVTTNGQSIGT